VDKTAGSCATGTEQPVAADSLLEYQNFWIVNNYRRANNIHPLKWHTDLNRAARYHAQDMAKINYFAHNSYDCASSGTGLPSKPTACDSVCTWNQRIGAFFPGSAAENIHMRSGSNNTAQLAFESWRDSPGHDANMRGTSRFMSVGYAHNPQRNFHFWVQNFGTISGQFPLIINHDSLETPLQTVELFVSRSDTNWNQYRLSNDSLTWSPWQPFPSSSLVRGGYAAWALAEGLAGQRWVYAEVRRGSDTATVRRSKDDILLRVGTPAGLTAANSLVRLQVYPNPALHELWLQGIEQPANWQIVNSVGQVVMSGLWEPGSALNISQLSSGMYRLLVTGASPIAFVK
jgi:hypothetical protein